MRDATEFQGPAPGPPTVMLVPEGTASVTTAFPGVVTLTPNPRAARAAGAPPRSLERLARELLRRLGLQPAWALAQWRALRWAVRERVPVEDVDGTSRAMAGTLREMLRAGLAEEGDPRLTELADASPRLARVTAVARTYRARLRERGLVDLAEALWCCARAVDGEPGAGQALSRRRMRVLGYPRIGPAEVAFLAAFAGDGSVLELPAGPDAIFDQNRAVARALSARGWLVEDRSGADDSVADDSVADDSVADSPVAIPSGTGDSLAERSGAGLGPPGAEAAERAPVRASAAPPALRSLRFASRDAEVRFALREVKRLLGSGVDPSDIVLVARDEAGYGPLVGDVAWEYEVPVAASYRIPLRETRVGAWTALLLEAVREALPFEAAARLLAHPLSGGLEASAWEAARLTHPHGLDAWRALDPRAAALDWPGRATRGALLARLRRAWRTFDLVADEDAAGGSGREAAAVGPAAPGSAAPGPAAPAPRLAPADALALQRLAAAASGLGTPASEPVTRAAFVHDLDALLTLVGVPADAGRPERHTAVELHTPLAVYGARYRHVFVLGAAEGAVPAAVADDPVLDFAERRLAAARGLPLEGAVEAARREALSFRAVLWTLDAAAPGSGLTISYPEDSGIASPVFAALGLEPTPPGPTPPASEEEVRRRRILEEPPPGEAAEPVLAAARHAWTVERRRETAAAPDAYDGVVGEPYRVAEHVFSATQLLDLGQCPFRWLARLPLRLAGLEEAEEDVTPLLRGRLYHRTLELALRRASDAAGSGADAETLRWAALEALEPAFSEAEVAESAVAVPAWPHRRAHHLEALRRVLAAASFLPAGAEVVALERRFPAANQDPPWWRGFPVRGVVDRIDRRDGRLVLVDYKTRSSRPAGVQDANGKARLDVQLPLYLEAAAPALFPGEPTGAAQYYSLTKAEVLAEVRLDAAEDAELTAFAERVRALLDAGRFPVAPDLDLQACRTCDFDLVCRKGPRTERMRAGGAFENGGGPVTDTDGVRPAPGAGGPAGEPARSVSARGRGVPGSHRGRDGPEDQA